MQPRDFAPEMEQAERELDARIDYALKTAREAEAQAAELEAKLAEDQEPPTDEQVERIKTYVLGHARTPEWEPVLERIERGHLTWRQIVDGLANGGLDREVAAAFDSMAHVPPASLEKLIEIGVFPADLPSEKPAEDEPEDEEPEADSSDYFQAAQEEEAWRDENQSPWRG